MAKNEPKIIARTIEQFNKLSDLYNSLPDYMQATVETIEYTHPTVITHHCLSAGRAEAVIQLEKRETGPNRIIMKDTGVHVGYDNMEHKYPFYDGDIIPFHVVLKTQPKDGTNK